MQTIDEVKGVPDQSGGRALAAPSEPPSPDFMRLIPRDFARRHLVLSAGADGPAERLLVSDRTSAAVILNVGTRLGRAVVAHPGDAESIARRIDAAYASMGPPPGGDDPAAIEGPEGLSAVHTGEEIDRLMALADRDLLSTSGKGPIVKLVDAMIFEALSRAGSDVHVQPLADRTLVRYRVDGVLFTARELPARLTNPVISRIKVMGRMDIAEKRLPQDGRATVTIGAGKANPHAQGAGREGARVIDLRISTFPTAHGERAVIRLLESARAPAMASNSDDTTETGTPAGIGAFTALGMSDSVRLAYLERAARSSGVVLVTGPTGSGKTTTLYTTLRWLALSKRSELNIMTIEDPIEYELSAPGAAISQGQVNTKKGITFANGLRHILRQDPDVIMVGEIRDAETARTAIQASLTGHLVFSTLHTNDAASAVTRLVDLGVEPYLVSASLSAVLAQRLVRRVHAECRGQGCAGCFHAGLLGRTGVFELLLIGEAFRDMIARGTTASGLRAQARARGMKALDDEGRRLVQEGATTPAEVARVVQGAGGDDEEPRTEHTAPPPSDTGIKAKPSAPTPESRP